MIDAVVGAPQEYVVKVDTGTRPRSVDGTKLSFKPIPDAGSQLDLRQSGCEGAYI